MHPILGERSSSIPKIVLVTALARVELPAVVRTFGLNRSVTELHDYWTGSIAVDHSHAMVSIYALASSSPGASSMSNLLYAALGALHPDLVILVGIAGGPANVVSFGDVVIGRSVRLYQHDSISKVLSPSAQPFHICRSLLDAVQQFTEKRGRRLHLGGEGDRIASRLPRMYDFGCDFHVGEIATVSRIVNDSSLATLHAASPDTLACEMEGWFFASFASRFDFPWLIVRGISDFADSATHECWLRPGGVRSAALAAARFVHAFVDYLIEE